MKRHFQFGGLFLALVLSVPALAQRSTAPAASLLTGGTQMPPASASILTMHSGFGNGGRINSGAHFSGQHNGSPQHHGSPVLGTVTRREHHERQRFVAPIYSGYYYPYYYGYGSSVIDEDYSDLPGAGTFNNGQGYADAEGADAPTIFENRRPSKNYYRPSAGENSVLDDRDSRYGDHYTDGREAPRASESRGVVSTNGNENNDTKTLLIFKDGVQREVTNYAIMGQYIFVFTGDRRKIPLAEIDLGATVKANEERGTEFKIPSSSNPS